MLKITILLFFIGLLIILSVRKENFMSPGVIDQLNSTRVYTYGEVRKNAEQRQKEIEHDLINLTGSV